MRKQFLIAVGVIGFFAFIIVNSSRYNDREEVLRDYSYTLGQIVSYRKVGDHSNRTLKYIYQIGERRFTRTISPEADFSYCEKDISLCDSKSFIVIFSKKVPSKSLIDLKHEIQ